MVEKIGVIKKKEKMKEGGGWVETVKQPCKVKLVKSLENVINNAPYFNLKRY